MTAPTEHTTEPHSLRVGIFMLVVAVVQGCDLIYDFKEERVTSGSTDCGDQLFRIRVPKKAEREPSAAASPQ